MTPSGPERWTVLRDPPAPGARNMAVDEALAREIRPGRGALRLYRWSRPTVSFGRNQVARGRYSAEAARARGVSLVRRPTGGRAVWHEEELTYAVALPVRSFGGLRPAYQAIHRGLVEGLRSLGVPVAVAGPPSGSIPGPAGEGTCFISPAEGEVVAGHRKLVGSAQVRIRRAILQHGSLLLEGEQERLGLLAAGDGAATRAPAATLSEFLDPLPPVEALEAALVEGLAAVVGGGWEEGALTDSERAVADRLVSRYESDDWTWRR